MIAKTFKQIALATIGTSCVAFGVATEAQAFGTLNLGNENGLTSATETQIDFNNSEMSYFGTGDFAFLGDGDGSVDLNPLVVPGGPVNSWFEFDDDSPFVFNLSNITFLGTLGSCGSKLSVGPSGLRTVRVVFAAW